MYSQQDIDNLVRDTRELLPEEAEMVLAARAVSTLKDRLAFAYGKGFKTPDGSPLGLYRARLNADLRNAEERLAVVVKTACEP